MPQFSAVQFTSPQTEFTPCPLTSRLSATPSGFLLFRLCVWRSAGVKSFLALLAGLLVFSALNLRQKYQLSEINSCKIN